MTNRSIALMAFRIEASAGFLLDMESTPSEAMLEALFVGVLVATRHRERASALVADFLATDLGDAGVVAGQQRAALADWIARGDGPAAAMLGERLSDLLARRGMSGG